MANSFLISNKRFPPIARQGSDYLQKRFFCQTATTQIKHKGQIKNGAMSYTTGDDLRALNARGITQTLLVAGMSHSVKTRHYLNGF